MKGRLFLDVVVRKSTAVLELFSSEDETLLVWRDTFFVLNLSLDVLDGIGCFDLKGNRFTGEGFDEDLHTTTEAEDQMKSRFLLDIVIRESSAVFELFSGKNKTLLIWRDTLFILKILLLNMKIVSNLKSNYLV